MTNLKQTSQAYEPKKTLNIADLDIVDLSWPVEPRTGKTKKKDDKGEEYEETYTYKVMIVGGIEYRVPGSVLEEIKKMLKLVPDLQFVNVESTGSGLSTKYSVEKAEEELSVESLTDL